ncbi:uncharacterized protein LOC101860203 [Aplysia californica]|uniref:Uncharacterized protein LOC101860203 n=1 Tax=Aplysia californica TaxID=6500 RepID=A0ABM0K690_APLCA|nr:uncharacterized protein LOC101860203 [Aplysia californica]
MTAAVAVMSASSTPTLPKRHGFSIESLIGKPDNVSPTPPPLPPTAISLQQPSLSLAHTEATAAAAAAAAAVSPASSAATSTMSKTAAVTPSPPPQRPLPIRPSVLGGAKEDRHHSNIIVDRERESLRDRELREFRDREVTRERERDLEILRDREARERELVLESMRERERELRELREARDREIANREREMRELRDNRDGRSSNPATAGLLHHAHSSPRSLTPPSPRLEKSASPETENRLSAWSGEEFKHLLGNFHGGQLDSNGLYQPLRVCNRALASMNGIGHAGPPGPLGVGVPPQFAHLPINPLLYNLPRDLSPQTHPLLAARYPGFMHPRYPMGPPPGLLFHPYRKPKRNRTAFSPSQLLQLEQAFEKNHYVVGQERKTLAAKLQLTETQVKVWFQNRRTKHKRMKAEEDGGSSGSHTEGQDGESGRSVDGSDLTTYVEHDDEEDPCSEEEEELSVTEDC